MNGVHEDRGMILDVLRDLFAGNLCVGDAGNLLPGADQGWAPLRYDLFEGFDQRVGFAGTGTGFETKVESVLQACLYTLLRGSRRGNGRRDLPRQSTTSVWAAASASAGSISGGGTWIAGAGGGSESHTSASRI